MADLISCPFCGAEIIKHRYSGFNDFIDELQVRCDGCGTDFHIKVGYPTIASKPQVKGKIDAIARWNTRTATVGKILAADVVERKWIPVTEQLPEFGKDVLIYFKAGRNCPHNRLAIAHYGTHDLEDNNFIKIGVIEVWYTDRAYYRPDEVAYWMPLPEPPGGEGDI